VLWVDDGFRTAAVGDPAGRFAWVLDRQPAGGADRIEAARRMLAFGGFDLSAMQMRP
jgi:apolipoprotein D and lipocalin family protein